MCRSCEIKTNLCNKFISLQTFDLSTLGIRATLTCHAKAPVCRRARSVRRASVRPVRPREVAPPGAAVPSRGPRSGGGGGFRSWPGARRRFGRVGGPARLRPFRRGAPLSPCAGAAVRSLAAGAAKPVFPPAPEAVVERSGCWFVRPPERRRGSLLRGRRSERGRCRIARFDAAARSTGDSLPRAFRVAEPATAHEASGRALPGHGAAGILPLHPTPHSLSRPA